MSKSRGNVIDPFELVDTYGADTVRYFLMREAPFGSDFSLRIENIRLRRNGDLGNDLGNLVRRSLAMLVRYREGRVPEPSRSTLGERFDDLGSRVGTHIAALGFRDALESIWEFVAELNRTIDERKPWDLHKRGETEALDALLYELCEGIRILSILLWPFMPVKATEIWQQLAFEGEPLVSWDEEFKWGRLSAGRIVRPSEAPLFPRLEAPPVLESAQGAV
jgi:methionyl-tRNA synthetase